jgi:hypothetical protein
MGRSQESSKNLPRLFNYLRDRGDSAPRPAAYSRVWRALCAIAPMKTYHRHFPANTAASNPAEPQLHPASGEKTVPGKRTHNSLQINKTSSRSTASSPCLGLHLHPNPPLMARITKTVPGKRTHNSLQINKTSSRSTASSPCLGLHLHPNPPLMGRITKTVPGKRTHNSLFLQQISLLQKRFLQAVRPLLTPSAAYNLPHSHKRSLFAHLPPCPPRSQKAIIGREPELYLFNSSGGSHS